MTIEVQYICNVDKKYRKFIRNIIDNPIKNYTSFVRIYSILPFHWILWKRTLFCFSAVDECNENCIWSNNNRSTVYRDGRT